MKIIVSIIITNFNYSKFINKCLKSCISQNFNQKKYEIIFVDDNSSDNSIKEINKYKKKFKNLKILKNIKNLGVAQSANRGIKNAKGKYIIRVDSDDYINYQLLNILASFLDNNKDFFSVSCDYYLVNTEGKRISKVSYEECPISCGIMYQKNKLLSLGGYNSKFRHREEEELRLRALKKGYKNFYTNLPLYYYLKHKKNKTNSRDFKYSFKEKINKLTLKDKFKEFKKNEKQILKNVVTIIPARLNSKRLKNKNLKRIWGKPMMYWCIKAAQKSQYINKIYVSSENKKVLNFAKKIGVQTVERPKELSHDQVYKIEVIKHAILRLKVKPSLVISLQPNSPDILSTDLDRGIEKLIKFNLNEVISTNKKGIQNAAFRIMKYQTLFQKSLSTYCGFVITDTSDIHTLRDLKIVEKNKIYENQ